MAYTRKRQSKSAKKGQLLEVVDLNNRAVGLMSWEHVHDQQLLHRSVQVCLYNQEHKLFIRKRSSQKTRYPDCWDLSATGHVRAAETPKEAAIRKLKDGLGIVVSRVVLLQSIPAEASTGFEFVSLFSADANAQVPQPDPREVSQGLFVEKHELASMVRLFADQLTSELLYFWEQDLLFT